MTRSLLLTLGMCLPLFLSSAGCVSLPKQVVFAYEDNLGLVVSSAEKACLTIRQAVSESAVVTIIDSKSQQRYEATVRMPTRDCIDQGARDLELRGYSVKFERQEPSTPFFGIAVVGASPLYRSAGGLTVADLDGDQHDEFFRSCTSAEGVHFTVWSDRPLTGMRRWHRYYPLGYDVSPTCTPAEVEAR
jgi:hypothetical protein